MNTWSGNTMDKPDKEVYRKEADKLARDFCPPIYPCKECGYPVINGYCCIYCGSTDPN